MNLCVIALVFMLTQTSAMVIHKQCFQKEKSLAVLELAKDSISKARDLIPECDGEGSNSTACGKKEQAAAYIEAALELIEEAKKHYPECNMNITVEPDTTTTPEPEATTKPESEHTPNPEPLPTDCLDILLKGHTNSGVYTIQLAMPEAKKKKMEVFCDLKTDGGGWTVLQRRDDYAFPENFNREWIDYKRGFGNITKDFWIGNDNIYYLTNVGKSEVRFDLGSQDLKTAFAQYESFKVEGETNLYKLRISGYSGNAGDALYKNDQMFFTTKDNKNDKWSNPLSCGEEEKGGWWFSDCGWCNLNGPYTYSKSTAECKNNLYYYQWKNCEPLKSTEIKIRRKQ